MLSPALNIQSMPIVAYSLIQFYATLHRIAKLN